MAEFNLGQLETKFKKQYEELLDLLAHAIYANRNLSIKGVSDGERLESAHILALKFFCHALTVLYLSTGTNQELSSLKWDSVDFASIDVITRAALEAFLVFHHVFYASANPQERGYRYWAYKAEGLDNELSIIGFAGTEGERKRLEAKSKEIRDKLGTNEIFQSLSPSNKRKVFKGNSMWRWKSDVKNRLSWRDISIEAGFSKVLANYIYNSLCGVAHSTDIGVRQTFPTTDKKEEKHLLAATVVIMNIVIANMIQEYYELFSRVQPDLSEDIGRSSLINEWIQRGKTLDKLMGVG